MRPLTLISLRAVGPWQYSVAHLMITVTLASGLLCSVISRSVTGVCVLGGAVGGGLTAVGWYYANRPTMVVGVCFTLITAASLLLGSCCVNIGDGCPSIPVTFEVHDARTGLPIVGARVRIRDLSLHNWAGGPPRSTIPAGEDGAESTTDRQGQAKVAYHFRASTRETYFAFKARVFVPGYLYVTVLAPGYAPANLPLQDLTGSCVEHTLDGSELAYIPVFLDPTAEPTTEQDQTGQD